MRTLQTISVYVRPIRLVTQAVVRQFGKPLMYMGFSVASIDALNFTLSVSQSDHNARKVVIRNDEKCIKCSDCDTDVLQTKEDTMNEANYVLIIARQLQAKAYEGALHATAKAITAMIEDKHIRYQEMAQAARTFATIADNAARVVAQEENHV